MTIATSWTAHDDEGGLEGGRDLLGTGAIADQLAAEVAPNLRAGTSRARYYMVLAAGTRFAAKLGDTSTERLRHLFRWERLWLVAQFERHASEHDTLQELREAIDRHEVGILGKGIGARSLATYLDLRGWGEIDLDTFVPLEAPQTSGMYGRYAGSARDSRILASGPLALDTYGEDLIDQLEDRLGESKLMSAVHGVLEARRCSPRSKACENLAAHLGLRDRPKGRERSLLTEALIEQHDRTSLSATVLHQVLSTRSTVPSWAAAVPRCVSAARKRGPDGEPLADALLAIIAYDELRTALELLLHKLNEALASAWSASIASLASDAGMQKVAEAVSRGARALLASPDVDATRGLRTLLSERMPADLRDAVELACAQHAEVSKRRGIAPWLQTRADRLELSRRPRTVSPTTGLGRYRLDSLRSLLADLQWEPAS